MRKLRAIIKKKSLKILIENSKVIRGLKVGEEIFNNCEC